VTRCGDAGRTSDGQNVPVSVDCAPFLYVEPPVGWSTDDPTDTVDGSSATENPRQTAGHMATGRVDNEPSPHTQSQGQGQVLDDGEQQSRIPSDAPSTDKNDNTGDLT